MRWARGKGKDREEDRELGRGWPIEAGWYRDREAGWYSGLDSETGWESDRMGKSSLSGLMESMPPIKRQIFVECTQWLEQLGSKCTFMDVHSVWNNWGQSVHLWIGKLLRC